MPVGTIVKMGQRGYGFIEPSDEGPRVFFHLKECFLRNVYLNVGDRVEYELNQFRSRNGQRAACEVRVISDARSAHRQSPRLAPAAATFSPPIRLT